MLQLFACVAVEYRQGITVIQDGKTLTKACKFNHFRLGECEGFA